jgi:protein-L-isoaspartate(D-aspartate) O-methyltransferase
MPASTDVLARKRRRMVEAQVAARGVRNARMLVAMRAVPREAFVPEELAEFDL